MPVKPIQIKGAHKTARGSKSPCPVPGTVPYWKYDSTDGMCIGRCRKYQCKTCQDTGRPCPLDGEHRIILEVLTVPDFMKHTDTKYNRDGNGKFAPGKQGGDE